MNGQKSKEVAKQRLQNLLMRDRSDVSPEVMEMVREDMIAAASEYFEIGAQKSQVYLSTITNEDAELDRTVLVCVISVSRVCAADTGQL